MKINTVSTEVIGGLLYKINANLIDEENDVKTCFIELLDYKYVTLTMKCPGEKVVVKKLKNK